MPGFEGVGIIVGLGTNAEAAKRFSEGQRVAFFPANGSWGEYVVVRYTSLLAIPNEIPNQVAAQMLINTITASLLIKAGHNSLKTPITPPKAERFRAGSESRKESPVAFRGRA